MVDQKSSSTPGRPRARSASPRSVRLRRRRRYRPPVRLDTSSRSTVKAIGTKNSCKRALLDIGSGNGSSGQPHRRVDHPLHGLGAARRAIVLEHASSTSSSGAAATCTSNPGQSWPSSASCCSRSSFLTSGRVLARSVRRERSSSPALTAASPAIRRPRRRLMSEFARAASSSSSRFSFDGGQDEHHRPARLVWPDSEPPARCASVSISVAVRRHLGHDRAPLRPAAGPASDQRSEERPRRGDLDDAEGETTTARDIQPMSSKPLRADWFSGGSPTGAVPISRRWSRSSRWRLWLTATRRGRPSATFRGKRGLRGDELDPRSPSSRILSTFIRVDAVALSYSILTAASSLRRARLRRSTSLPKSLRFVARQ